MDLAAPDLLIDDILLEDIVDEEVEKVKRCHVPYERLDISCSTSALNREEVHYLFDEK